SQHFITSSSHTLSSRPLVLFLLILPPPPRPTLFPYTTLFRSAGQPEADPFDLICHLAHNAPLRTRRERAQAMRSEKKNFFDQYQDRKSTRLNSSHVKISYAVFCLKKKKKNKAKQIQTPPTTQV